MSDPLHGSSNRPATAHQQVFVDRLGHWAAGPPAVGHGSEIGPAASDQQLTADGQLSEGCHLAAARVKASGSAVLMFGLESEFGIQFSDAQLTTFQNVGELRRYLVQAPE